MTFISSKKTALNFTFGCREGLKSVTPENDQYIFITLKSDRELGFRMLLKRYAQPVYWHIRRMVVSHADTEDVSQEVWLRVFRSIGGVRSHEALSSWIYRIAVNETLRYLSRRPVGVETLEECFDAEADEYIDYSDAESVKLQKALLSLPPKQRLVFSLRYYDDFDYERIAEVMDSKVSRVKANYHLAKEKIIDYLKENC